MQAVNDFLLSKLEHVVAVLAPHATARPVADLLEAMSQGVSSFRMEHDIKVCSNVFIHQSALHALAREADSVQSLGDCFVMTCSNSLAARLASMQLC